MTQDNTNRRLLPSSEEAARRVIEQAERILPGQAAPDGEEDPRWQAIIAVSEFIQSDPELVWQFVGRWGCHDDEDLRAAVATCLLEHLLEHHFERLFPRVEKLALENRNFGTTFLSSWKFGQSEEPSNSKRFDGLRSALGTPPDGYLADPATGAGPGVLVLHAWWGLNETMRDFCRRLAEAGFVAFAPDLFHGRVTDSIPAAQALSEALDAESTRRDIAEATRFLAELSSPSKGCLAVIGFSLGAYYALECSVTDPERIRSVVVFYGSRSEDYGGSKSAYLAHLAETDPSARPASRSALDAALAASHSKTYAIHHSAFGYRSDARELFSRTGYRLRRSGVVTGRPSIAPRAFGT